VDLSQPVVRMVRIAEDDVLKQRRKRRRRIASIIAGIAMLLAGAVAPAAAQQRDLVVYAEATLKPVIRTIGQMWRAKSGVRVNVFVARTELSFAQIERGPRCDVIFALAGDTMDDAENDKLVKPGTVVPAFRNPLVLVGRDAPASGGDLKSIVAGKRLALADPDRDPAGRNGLAALAAAGIALDPESDTVAVAENTLGVLRMLADNKAQLGIVFATDLFVADIGRRSDLKVVMALPPATYPAIEYVVATAVNAQSDTTPFLEFLKSDTAMAAFKAAGLEPTAN
jgi:molybdate transport system substrate-binding protein